jgi:hypothetical protein
MPLPRPEKNEDKNTFMQRCMAKAVGDGMPQDQAAAACMVAYDKGPEKELSELDKLAKIKTYLEKFGYTLDDSFIGQIMEHIKIKPVSLERDGQTIHIKMLDSIVHGDQQVLPTGGDQWILVFPRGKHYIQKEDTWLDFNDAFFGQIADAFDDDRLTKPFIDKNHEYQESFGNITSYNIDDAGMHFQVKLNNAGIDLVRSEQYKYISPSFGPMVDTTKTPHENVLLAVSLTNIPALMATIPSLQDQLTNLENKIKGEKNMFHELTSILNLQDGASESTIAAAIQSMMDSGQEKDAIIAELKAELEKLQADMAEKDAVMQEQGDELTKLKTEQATVEAEKVVDKAIELQQFHPAVRDIKIKAYLSDKDAVLQEIALLPKKDTVQLSGNTPNSSDLTTLDYQIMDNLGLDRNKPEDVQLYKSSQAE